MNHEEPNSRTNQEDNAQGDLGVGHPDVPGYQESGSSRGPTTSGTEEGHSGWKVGDDLEKLRDHLRSRPSTGIPGHRQVDISELLLQSFLGGNFEVALVAAEELSLAYREALLESSKLRFKLNFGTQVCENCEGLQAGSDVVATCFQVKSCNFQNIHTGSASPRQLKILKSLTTG
jgi:hypothetical protein